MEGSTGLQFGLMQFLGRMSGDSPAIMIVVSTLMIPLFQNAPRIFQWLLKTIAAYLAAVPPDTARRVIEFTDGENMSVVVPGSLQEETSTERNNILQKAIRLYINREKGRLQITDAELYLFASSSEQQNGAHHAMADPYGRPRRSVKHVGDSDASLKKLMGYSVARGPREDRWLLVDADRGVHFKFYSSTAHIGDGAEDTFAGKGLSRGGRESGNKQVGRKTTTFELKATGPGAEERLDAFVEDALGHYKTLKASALDTSRYFFMPSFPKKSNSLYSCDSEDELWGKGGGRGRCGATKCKRYLLSERKTFKSLFFPEKPQVLSMLDDFLERRGKFAIEGFPDKLGLLLHGPPGTGKTSLIKSIASYTKRHIVEVPLSKVTTNKVLFDTMFDLVFAVTGEDEALRMNFNDIIFVMEDVDAVSKVVYARSPRKEAKKNQTAVDNDAGRGKAKGKGKGNMHDPQGKGHFGGKGKSCASWAWPGAQDGVLVQPHASGEQLVSKLTTLIEGPSSKPATAADTTDVAGADTPSGMDFQIPQLMRAASAPASCLSMLHPVSIGSPDTHSADLGAGWNGNGDDVVQDAQKHDEEEQDEEGEEEEEGEDEGKEEAEDEEKEDENEEQQREMLAMGFMKGFGKSSKGMQSKATGKKGANQADDPDKLNLAGLLNVLDGVVDSPGRIVIMTTNHPEKLDPALIRPGRINFAIELGFMKAEPLCELIQHIMAKEMTQSQRQTATTIAERCKLTPAQVEQSCAMASNIDELLEHLRLTC
eukprot:TRINITY_DN90713_c0_g1_i1.p1 TRINITY_DN90713_c0_g1~~TRINITY_DN90713_c0_g1_i1.p1  ORF type:complete len:766 (+),score=175.79 TRINITY_DN90713_c0_g1_i1:56-2353(+)